MSVHILTCRLTYYILTHIYIDMSISYCIIGTVLSTYDTDVIYTYMSTILTDTPIHNSVIYIHTICIWRCPSVCRCVCQYVGVSVSM